MLIASCEPLPAAQQVGSQIGFWQIGDRSEGLVNHTILETVYILDNCLRELSAIL